MDKGHVKKDKIETYIDNMHIETLHLSKINLTHVKMSHSFSGVLKQKHK